MSIHFVHYDAATGAIRQVGVGAPFEIAGAAVAEFRNVTYWELTDTTQWRVDLGSVQQRAGTIPLCAIVKVN